MIHRIETEKRYLNALSILDDNKSVANATINDVICYVSGLKDKLHRRNMQIKDYKSRIVNAEDYQIKLKSLITANHTPLMA